MSPRADHAANTLRLVDPLVVANVSLILLGLPCVLSVIGGLPGAWIFLGFAAALELADHWWLGPGVTSIGWGFIAGGVFLAAVGELIEFLSGSLGVKSGGGSKRGMMGAFVGGIVVALLFTVLVPIPLVGTLLGALVGTFGGAWVGEISGREGIPPKAALKPAFAATVGRLVGTVVKGGIATVVWLELSVAAILAMWG